MTLPLAHPPLVSVLMPMRNPGRYLMSAVASVLSQDWPDLELVVVDDGCTDGSREWLSAHPDTRIRVLEGPRQGIAAGMNTALAAARGTIVMRCDADDLFPPGRVKHQVDWLMAHPDNVAVCSPFEMISPMDEPVSRPWATPPATQTDVSADLLAGRLSTHLCTYAIRLPLPPMTGGSGFRAFFETAEDIDFQLRLAAAGPVGLTSACSYLYRLHDLSITHTQASARRKFFERTAYDFSEERQRAGTDALMRGTPPAPPTEPETGHRPDTAGHHMCSLLVGEAWRAFAKGDRVLAVRQARRAVRADFRSVSAWKTLLLVLSKPLPP